MRDGANNTSGIGDLPRREVFTLGHPELLALQDAFVKEDVHYRTEAWDFFIAGGSSYDNLDYSFTPSHPDGTLTDFRSPGGGGVELRKQLSILKRFMEQMDFVKMKPISAAVTGGSVRVPLGHRSRTDSSVAGSATARALVQEGKAYAVYIRGGTSADVALALPTGQYKAQWLNTKTGAIDKAEDFSHAGGDRELTSRPYVEDVALRITRQ